MTPQPRNLGVKNYIVVNNNNNSLALTNVLQKNNISNGAHNEEQKDH